MYVTINDTQHTESIIHHNDYHDIEDVVDDAVDDTVNDAVDDRRDGTCIVLGILGSLVIILFIFACVYHP